MEMIGWALIVVLAAAIFVVLKLKHTRHKLYAILFIVLLLFLYTTFTFVTTQYNVDFKSKDGAFLAFKIYFTWLGHSVENMKVLAGNAFKMDWKLKNETEE